MLVGGGWSADCSHAPNAPALPPYLVHQHFRAAVIVVAGDTAGGLLKANVVEAGKGGTRDIANGVIGYQEVFLMWGERERDYRRYWKKWMQ